MSGWAPFPVDEWPETVELLTLSGKPWTLGAAVYDLRWHVDQRVPLPGRPELVRRWGWTDWQVRELLADTATWWDTATKGEPPASREELEARIEVRQRRASNSPPTHLQLPSNSRTEETPHSREILQPASNPPPTRLHTRDGDPPSPSPSLSAAPPLPPDEPIPTWARKRQPPRGRSRLDLVAVVVGAKEAVLGGTPNPERCGDAAKVVLALWEADGARPPPDFLADFGLVAVAARECPLPLFARDIRAEGWAGGTDRRRSIATLCVQDRWAERLHAAKAWDARGRPSGRNGHVSPPARAAPEPNPFEEFEEPYLLEMVRRGEPKALEVAVKRGLVPGGEA